jgi:hypothetical protein
MAVATITLSSTNGDSVVVSAPNDTYLADEIILDTEPKGLYDTGFTVRTQSGAFETGGRIVGDQVPIREMVLPFWLTKASRARFFKVAGTLTGSGTSLTGTSHSLTVTSGIPYNASTATIQSALESLSSVGAGKVTVTGTSSAYLVVFAVGTNGVLTGSATNLTGTGHKITIDYAPNTAWFDVWNPTDQPDWLEWTFDPAEQWKFPDFAFGQERKWGRTVGEDAARLIVTVPVTSLLSVMSDPFMDTYLTADLSNFAGLMNGVEPVYAVPPYTGTEASPILEPVICFGPAGATATLRQRRFWSAESGLEA